MLCNIMGCGGVGLMTLRALDNMLGRRGGFARVSWGGVGWGGDVNVPCTWTHVGCYATGCFSRTCTHV